MDNQPNDLNQDKDNYSEYKNLLDQYASDTETQETVSTPPAPILVENNFQSLPPEELKLPEGEPILNLPPVPTYPQKNPDSTNIFKYIFFASLIIFLVVYSILAFTLIKKPSTANTTIITTNTAVPTTSPTSVPTQVCALNDKNYEVGESFTAADGCNTCTCSADLSINCTEKVCPTAKPSTPSASTSNIPKDWVSYTNKELGIAFSYPKNWGNPTTFHEPDPRGSNVIKGESYGFYFKNGTAFNGQTADYKAYDSAEGREYNGSENNLDVPETQVINPNLGSSTIYFIKKITVANQKTSIKNSFEYLPEASGVSFYSAVKLNGNTKYKGLVVSTSYKELNDKLNKNYSATETNSKIDKEAEQELNNMLLGKFSDKQTELQYQTFLSVLKTIKLQ